MRDVIFTTKNSNIMAVKHKARHIKHIMAFISIKKIYTICMCWCLTRSWANTFSFGYLSSFISQTFWELKFPAWSILYHKVGNYFFLSNFVILVENNKHDLQYDAHEK